MRNLATKPFSLPGEPGWPLGGLFPAPASKTEGGKIARLLIWSLLFVFMADLATNFYVYCYEQSNYIP